MRLSKLDKELALCLDDLCRVTPFRWRGRGLGLGLTLVLLPLTPLEDGVDVVGETREALSKVGRSVQSAVKLGHVELLRHRDWGKIIILCHC